ncbi:MAG: type II toxin-antitoxin system RelE/ParE family toxin [Myxococcota bacterium]|nr:type II toxin-antitoxin system RelE/ParE family toxin [Myxococcota bacterium]
MYLIQKSEWFDKWFSNLKDVKAKARILTKIKMAELGNLGDNKSIGHGISEMRIHYGPGYRVYYTKRNQVLLILLVGGDKSSQSRDIKKAQSILKSLEVPNA